jgi:hypothetical protein
MKLTPAQIELLEALRDKSEAHILNMSELIGLAAAAARNPESAASHRVEIAPYKFMYTVQRHETALTRHFSVSVRGRTFTIQDEHDIQPVLRIFDLDAQARVRANRAITTLKWRDDQWQYVELIPFKPHSP